jgi:hypothetical protein
MPGSDIPAIDRLFDKKGRDMVIVVHAGPEFVISGYS